jgi:hypothetical protein
MVIGMNLSQFLLIPCKLVGIRDDSVLLPLAGVCPLKLLP